jgi:hypothetical protein
MNKINEILKLNANQKYIEYLLYIFDNEAGDLTLKEIRKKFKQKFSATPVLLNQYFGIMRLLPLIQIKEIYKKQNKQFTADIEKIKIIRDSIAHNSFTISENGYYFHNDKGIVKFGYDEFQAFLHKIENSFYQEFVNIPGKRNN